MAVYTVELYNSQSATQTFVADITSQVTTFNYSVPLNNFEELSFTMGLEAWRLFCTQQAIDPYISIRPYTAEIKLKRDGSYLPMVFEIKQAPKRFSVDSNGIDNSTITIQARGTLSKLGDAIITKTYDQIDATAIARDIIATRQAKTYGDFGITNGNTYLTGQLSDRTYQQYNCMDAIRNLSDDASGGFDFYFDHDWAFYTMAQRGSIRNELVFKFGGENSNVLDYENPEDATTMGNSVTIVGAGIGDPLLNTPGTGLDDTSAITYGLRERALVFSQIDNQQWLDARADFELQGRKDIYDLPKFSVSGDVMDLNTYWVGDTVPIECTDGISPYDGQGRIKQLDVSVDVNHQEVISVECIKV